jgi:hypothetical protein
MLNKQTATKSNTTQPEAIQQRATAKLTDCSHNKTREHIKRNQRHKNNIIFKDSIKTTVRWSDKQESTINKQDEASAKSITTTRQRMDCK